jgi:hypothetical protein
MLGEELDMALTWNGAFGTRDEAAWIDWVMGARLSAYV